MSEQSRIVNERYALAPNPRTGGMSDVFTAVDLKDNLKKCALKLFGAQLADDLLAEAFRRESAVLRDLKHDNVVILLDCRAIFSLLVGFLRTATLTSPTSKGGEEVYEPKTRTQAQQP